MDELLVSSFHEQVSTLCLDSVVNPLRPGWVKDVSVLGCNRPFAFLAEFVCPG